MKANELRIGNWFIEYEEPQQFDGDFYHLSDIKFIPLTEEWLLKFGFDEEGEQYNLKGISIEDIHNGEKWCVYMFDEYHNVESSIALIKHVHQLQNLYFALTGEELTLKEL